MSHNDSHVMVNGITGFVGQAFLERLLACYPDCRVTVLVRPQVSAENDLGRLTGIDPAF